jgi:ankyrin repeat protein
VVNRRNVMGMTPLLLAAGRKPDSWSARVCHTLIKHGADTSLADLTGRTPLSVALSSDNTIAAQVLIHEGGADALRAVDTVRWSHGGHPLWVAGASALLPLSWLAAQHTLH